MCVLPQMCCCCSRHADANTNRPSKAGGATFPANKQLSVDIKARVRPENASLQAHICIQGVFRRSRQSSSAVSTSEQIEREMAKGCVETSARARLLHERPPSSPPRPRLVQTQAPGDKTVVKPQASSRCRARSAMPGKQAARFPSPARNLCFPPLSLLSSVPPPQKQNRLLFIGAASSALKSEWRGLIGSDRSQRLRILQKPLFAET